MRSWRQMFAAAAAAVVLSACGHVIPGRLTGDGKDFDFARPCPAAATPAPQAIEVRYLGSGNVYIRWQDDAILLGPSFSRPNLFRAGLGGVVHDERRIAAALATLPNVRAILAGHSHYDHLGDLPVVAKAIDAPIYVNAHGAHMLAPYKLGSRVRKIAAGEDFAVGAFRIHAIASGHAPQLCPWNWRICRYADGPIETDWDSEWPKRRLRAMRGGDTLAFAIDLPGYRIYYNDAASASPLGQTEGPFDLAILTAAQWNRARDYPRDLLNVIQPRHVIVSHWENFFTAKKTEFVFGLKPIGFIETVDKLATGGSKPWDGVCGARNDRYTMPMPGASMFFSPR